MSEPQPSNQPVGWGILGAARIAGKAVLPALRHAYNAEVVAIASKDLRRAARYAEDFDIPDYYGAYEPMLYNPAVEAVYIALANADHALWTQRALEAGKHVLVEKPFALNAYEALAMTARARENYLMVMEAFMYRFHPQFEEIRWLVADGAIGELRLVRSAFSYQLERTEDFRWSRPLGGGALFDVGCYGVSVARAFIGRDPISVTGQADLGRTGVDESFYGVLDFGDGVRGVLDCSLRGARRQQLELVGSTGTITLVAPWQPGPSDTGYFLNGELCLVRGADQYRLMVEHFSNAVRGLEPLRFPPEDAVRQAKVMDALIRSARTGSSVKMD
jgi:D-xylose 1-dehydrogenase (NADP+, D-xylono-1,5-lactone-forming)